MIYSMVRVDKETTERELLWHPDSDEDDLKEEAIAALEHYGDKVIIDGDYVTGEKYEILFELCG